MRVKCVLCDKIDILDDELPLAKRLRNRPIHTYMCDECNERIRIKTENRMKTGKFNLYKHRIDKEEW
ncbi:YlaI family protein [Calidifontibacillus erzurumensis]|uniref:YlaI family protein n=1 Tax=Calidifontibacillus erzurumensis TaxID=2741433 RepID=A0A8J8GE56_9BACI|nr:YlaI family protein [Calidifontibacillus erzurumensis]NSL50733.1 YlaI family protein [Calidifontibacillus erzurumensis]